MCCGLFIHLYVHHAIRYDLQVQKRHKDASSRNAEEARANDASRLVQTTEARLTQARHTVAARKSRMGEAGRGTLTSTEPLTDAEQAVAEDLTQIFVLGDKYQLPALRCRTLKKLANLIPVLGYPVRFLYLVTILDLYIPELDEQFRAFVQANLKRAIAIAGRKKGEMVNSVIESGYMR